MRPLADRMAALSEPDTNGGCNVEAPFYDTEAEAIAAWNTRASGSGEAELRLKVEKAFRAHGLEGFDALENDIVTLASTGEGSGEAVADLCSRLDAIVTEEDQFHPVGCSTWWEESRVAVDMAKDFIRRPAPPSTDSLGDGE